MHSMTNDSVIAFVHISKTGGTTLNSILRRNYGLRHFDRPGVDRPLTARDLRRIAWLQPRLKSIAGHQVRPDPRLRDAGLQIEFYTFLRDPIERLISRYKFALRRAAYSGRYHDDFYDPLERLLEHHRDWQCFFLSGTRSADAAIEVIEKDISFVGLVERYDESLVLFRNWLGEPAFDIRYDKINTAEGEAEARRISREYLREINEFAEELKNNSALFDSLRGAAREDQKLYAYVRDHRYRAQCIAYGPDLEVDADAFRQANSAAQLPRTNLVVAKLFRRFVIRPIVPFLISDAK